MENITKQFLTIIGNFAGNCHEKISNLTKEDWVKIFEIAKEQKLECAVFESTYGTPMFETAEKQLQEDWKNLVQQRGILEVQKLERFWEVYEVLEREGAEPLVLKGVVCRFLYSKPYARPSGDEDLLIKETELKTCGRILTGMGLENVSEAEGNVTKYVDVKTGLQIEVHSSLFDGGTRIGSEFNSWFTDNFNTSALLEINGHKIRTLHPTLHLLYLLTHWIKHFVGPGIGIRQICDISMFINRWGNRVDWEQLMRRMDSKNFALLTANLLVIGIRYFHLDRKKIDLPEELLSRAQPEELIQDMMNAGIYGSSSISRLHSSTFTLDALEGHKGKLRVVFPPSKVLERRYPFLKKHIWLLPAAWMHRLISYGTEVVKNRRDRNSPGESIAIGTSRVRLMRKYNVIK